MPVLAPEYDLAFLGAGDVYNAAAAVGDVELGELALSIQRFIDSRKFAHVPVRDWAVAEMVALSNQLADEAGIPRKLPLGCMIAESNIRQYAERWGYRTEWGVAAVATPSLDDDQAVLDQIAADGTPLDVSFGAPQQIVRYAPVGDGTMTPANVLVVRAWLFDPANSIPVMVSKLAGSFHDPNNPGTTEDERVMLSLYKYNTGNYRAPSGVFAGNVGNYRQALVRADAMLAAP